MVESFLCLSVLPLIMSWPADYIRGETFTERPTRRFLFNVLRPPLVLIRARKPLFRFLFTLLLRWFSILPFSVIFPYMISEHWM